MSGQLREQISFKGLFTNPNEFAIAGAGAMREFTNMLLTRPDLAQKRRGSTRNATNSVAINKIFAYDSGQIFHCGSGSSGALKKWVPSTGVVTAYSGQINPSTGRLRACIANKNFYYAGPVVGRLSGLSGTPTAAGGVYAPGLDRYATTFLAGSIIEDGKSMAYRIVFGLTDAKGSLILGEPSGRVVITNSSTATSNPKVRAIIPTNATTNHFIQFYRSAKVAAGSQPDDNLQLVYEIQLKSTDISNGYLDLTDICPEGARGATLYTAPLEEGIDAANRPPPGCVEICEHMGRTWFGNTTQPGEFRFSIIGVGGSAGIQSGDNMVFGGLPGGSAFDLTFIARRDYATTLDRAANVVTGTTTDAHTFQVGDSVVIAGGSSLFGIGPFVLTAVNLGAHTFTYSETGADSSTGLVSWTVFKDTGGATQPYYITSTSGSASYNNRETALNFVSTFNRYTPNTSLYARWMSQPNDLDQGQIEIFGRTSAIGAFTVGVAFDAKRDCFVPTLAPAPKGFNLVRTSNVVTATSGSGNHGFRVGESVTIAAGGAGSGGSTFGTGPFAITAVAATTFTYAETGTNGSLATQTASLYPTDTSVADVEAKPNRVYFSKSLEPEATTRTGWFDVGSPDSAILAMKSQRGQIWVWKTDGIFRIRGEDEDSFAVEAMDASLHVLATESVVLFNNRCWGFTDRGVVAVSESGIEVMSQPVANDLRLMVAAVNEGSATSVASGYGALGVETDCFATAYESENLYILHVPDIASRDAAGKYGGCRYAYVYTSPPHASGQQGTWAFWDWGIAPVSSAAISKRCGLVLPGDDKLYFGDGFNGAAGEAYITQERKIASVDAVSLNYGQHEDDVPESVSSASLTRTSGTTVVATVASHSFKVGNRVRPLVGSADFPAAERATITAVTATTFTYTQAGSNVTLAGQVMVLSQPIPVALTWVLQTAGAPGSEKRWDELEFLFAPYQIGQNLSFLESQVAFSLTLSNETSTVTHTIDSQGLQIARVWLDKEVARGSRLLVRITHSTANERFDLAGMAVKSEVLGGAVTR